MSTFLAVVEGGRLRPLEETDLREGQELRVDVSPAVRGSQPAETPGPSNDAVVGPAGQDVDSEWNDPLAGLRFDGPADLASNFDDYRFGRKTWP